MTQSAIESFSVTRQIADPRADGGARVVHVGAAQIVIERAVEGVRMKVAVPVAAYTGLVLSVRFTGGTATLALRHEDRDLDVPLASGEAMEMGRQAKAWGALFGKPIDVEQAGVAMYPCLARQWTRSKPKRRSSFAGRRKVGVLSRLATSFQGEREIIART